MYKLAIDASTAAQWQLSEESEAERARHMLRDYAAEKVAFVAPTIWHYEVANIVNKAVGTRRLTEGEGYMAFQALQALYNAVRQSLPFVQWIGDYVSPEHP